MNISTKKYLLDIIKKTVKNLDEIAEQEKNNKNFSTEIPVVEIDINCRKNTQISKIYGLLLAITSLEIQTTVIAINQILLNINPNLKEHILDLAQKDDDEYYKKIKNTFPALENL